MTIEKEINKLRKRQGSRTVLAFIAGAFLGGIFGMDFFIALLTGTVLAILIWTGYSDDIATREKERTLDRK